MAKRRTSWTEGESRWVGLQVVFPGFSRILPTQILLVFIFVVLCSVQKFGVRRKDDFGDGAIRYFCFCLAVHQCTFGQMFRACSISICLFEFCACVLCLNRSVVLSLVCLSSSCQRIVCCFCPPHQLAFGSGQRFCR